MPDSRYFKKFRFTPEQVRQNMENALKDLKIAKEIAIPEVRFNYTYTALIKAGIALLSYYGIKAKSVPGHHIKIIEQISSYLKDEETADVGNLMRSKRNAEFYGGGAEITVKECKQYLNFVQEVLIRIKKIIAE